MQDYRISLEELCATTIAMARDFVENFPAAEVAVDVLERNSLRRSLRSFAEDGGISEKNSSDPEFIASLLGRELERETLGWISSFEGVVDAENGAIGRDVEVRDLSPRGRMIKAQARQLESLVRKRQVCRARLDAVKVIMGR